MVAQAVKEAVGVGGDAGRGERYQGAQRGRLAFQRHLVEQVAVHVGVEGGVVFDQVLAAFDGHGGRLDADCELDVHVLGHGRTDIHIADEGCEPRWP